VKARFLLLLLFVLAGWPPAFAEKPVIRTVVDNNTLIPGTQTPLFISGTTLPAIYNGVVVFNPADPTDVYTVSLNGKNLTRVISSATPIPGIAGATFAQAYGGALQIVGNDVVFEGEDQNFVFRGYYAVPANGGRVRQLVSAADISQGLASSDFHVNLDTSGAGQLVFAAGADNAVYRVPVAGGKVVSLAGPQDQGVAPPEPYCCQFDEPDTSGDQTVFEAINGLGVDSIQSVSPDGTHFRILEETESGRFANYNLQKPQIDGGTLVFVAVLPQSPAAFAGIWSLTPQHRLTRLMDTHSHVPGGTGTFQRNNGFVNLAARDGLVVFQGVDAAGVTGIYEVGETGGKITKVIAIGDPLPGGEPLGDFQLSPEPLSYGVLVFWGNSGTLSGIYAAKL
jgi:hypothetical protein